MSLYGATFLGTWYPARSALGAKAEAIYERHRLALPAWRLRCQERGLPPEACVTYLHEDGPGYSVLSLPVLPGIAVLSTFWSIGPLFGHGSTDLVLWYGFGTIHLAQLGESVS